MSLPFHDNGIKDRDLYLDACRRLKGSQDLEGLRKTIRDPRTALVGISKNLHKSLEDGIKQSAIEGLQSIVVKLSKPDLGKLLDQLTQEEWSFLARPTPAGLVLAEYLKHDRNLRFESRWDHLERRAKDHLVRDRTRSSDSSILGCTDESATGILAAWISWHHRNQRDILGIWHGLLLIFEQQGTSLDSVLTKMSSVASREIIAAMPDLNHRLALVRKIRSGSIVELTVEEAAIVAKKKTGSIHNLLRKQIPDSLIIDSKPVVKLKAKEFLDFIEGGKPGHIRVFRRVEKAR